MSDVWTFDAERYRYATRADLPSFVELLTDPEVGRWLWFTPLPPEGVEAYFGPLLDRQSEEVDAGKTPENGLRRALGAT